MFVRRHRAIAKVNILARVTGNLPMTARVNTANDRCFGREIKHPYRPCARLETTANLGIARLVSLTDDRALNALDLA
jgi:hypothetical protein